MEDPVRNQEPSAARELFGGAVQGCAEGFAIITGSGLVGAIIGGAVGYFLFGVVGAIVGLVAGAIVVGAGAILLAGSFWD